MSEVKVKFGAEDTNLSSTLNKVQKDLGDLEQSSNKATEGFSGGFGKMAGTAAIAGAAVAAGMKAIEFAVDAARAVVSQFGEALDMGGRLNDLSGRTGETAGALLLLERAFDNAGSSAEKVGPSINKLQKFIFEAGDASGSQAKVLDQLGIALTDLQGKTPTEQMRVFAEKITAIQDPTARAAAAMTIFGKSGGEMLPMLQNFSGEIATAQGQLGSLPGVMDKSSAVFDTVSDNLTVIKNKTLELAAGFLEQASPALLKFSNMLAGVDAAGWGQKLMENVMAVADLLLGAFQNPMAAVKALGFEVLAIGAKFMNEIGNSFNYLTTLGTKVFGLLAFEITDLFVGAFKNSWELFTLSGQRAIESLRTSDAMNSFAAGINALWDVISSGGEADYTASFEKYKTAGVAANAEVIASLDQKIWDAAQTYSDGIESGTTRVSDKWDEIMSSTEFISEDLFKAGEVSKAASEQWDEVAKSGKKTRDEWVGVQTASQNAGVAVANVAFQAERAANASNRIKNDMVQINNVADLIAAKEKAPDKGNFGQRWKQAKKDAEDYAEYLGGDFSNKSVRDMAKVMKIDVTKKSSEELLDEIETRMSKIKGIQVLAKMDKNATKEEIDAFNSFVAAELRDLEMKVGTDEALSMITQFTGQKFQLDMNADSSIEGIKNELAKPMTVNLEPSSGSTGESVMESIKTAVEEIKRLVALIEPKLPTTALGV